MLQIREKFFFTKGRVTVRGKTVKRGKAKKADYLLIYRPNFPLGVLEAKDANHDVGAGMPQALEYAEILDLPFAYSSNGEAFLEHNRTAKDGVVERGDSSRWVSRPGGTLAAVSRGEGLHPGAGVGGRPGLLRGRLRQSLSLLQIIAINRTVEAIVRGQDRILLVMATGTGKTFTAFQIIWRLWKSGAKKRILFLVDRNILADQTKTNDFKPFGKAMTKITNRTVDKSYEIYLCLYQAVTGIEEEQNIYKQFSPDFFDLVIVDECHRGSAADDAAWRKVLDYFWGKPDKHGHYSKRQENEQAWRVSIDQIKAGGYNLDLKNPNRTEQGPGDVDHLLPEYEKILAQIAETRAKLKKELQTALSR